MEMEENYRINHNWDVKHELPGSDGLVKCSKLLKTFFANNAKLGIKCVLKAEKTSPIYLQAILDMHPKCDSWEGSTVNK